MCVKFKGGATRKTPEDDEAVCRKCFIVLNTDAMVQYREGPPPAYVCERCARMFPERLETARSYSGTGGGGR